MRLDDELATRAAALEAGAPDGASSPQRARAAAARLAPVELAPGDLRGALSIVAEHAEIDANVPVAATRREVTFVKRFLRKLLGWYVRWLANQVTLLGRALVRFGTATAERFDAVERDVDDLSARVAALEAKVRSAGNGGG
jgi:hypothetical protein